MGAPPLTHARRALTLLLVFLATLAGGYGALATFAQTKELSVGEIRLSVSPGHRGALDVYVPLVDWGARFEAIRLPVRLRVDLRTVDRQTVTRVAQAGTLDVQNVRSEARDAIAGFLKALIGVTMLAALSLGLLVAFAIRSRTGPRLRWTAALAAVTTLGIGIAMVVLLPPRGEIDHPQYYAHGADIPRALEAVDAAQRSTRVLDEELDAQLVGLARLVTEPANRVPLDRRAAAHGRLRPAQQRAHDPDPRALRRRRARAVPGRPDRPRLAAGGARGPAGRQDAASRSCSSRATTTPTRSSASSPARARSSCPRTAG